MPGNPLFSYFRAFAQDFIAQYALEEVDEKLGTSTKTRPSAGSTAATLFRKWKSSGDDVPVERKHFVMNSFNSKMFAPKQSGRNYFQFTPFISYNVYDNYPYLYNIGNRNRLKRELLVIAISWCLRHDQIASVGVFKIWIDARVDGMSDAEVREELARLQNARNADDA